MRKITRFAAIAAAASAVLAATGGTGYADAGSPRDTIGNLKALYEVHTIAGTGDYRLSSGAPLGSAFRTPSSLLKDNGTDAYLVSDTGNQQLRYITSKATDKAAGLYIGSGDKDDPLGSFVDGPAAEAAFNGPAGLAQDASGNVYVADAGNNAIRRIDAEGKVTTVAGTGVFGDADGAGAKAEFDHPLDVAVTKDGVIYVADTLNHVIRQIKNGAVTTLTAHSDRIVEYSPGSVAAAGDYADGPIGQAKFNEPSGLALDGKGNLYVSDTGNDLIRYIDFKAGKVTTVAGAGAPAGTAGLYGANAVYAEGGFADGAARAAKFHAPRGIDVTADGGVLIADSLNHAIRYLFSGSVTTIAGTPGEEGRVDGLAGSGALLNLPTDVVWLGGGAMAVADSGSGTIRVVEPYRAPAEVKADGTIHLLYGTKLLQSDANPIIKESVTFVPVRVLAEQLGYSVQYENGQTTLRSGTTAYTVRTGSSAIARSSEGNAKQTFNIAGTPFNAGGRLFLPVRFFAEELGLDVQWLPDLRAVLLRSKTVGH